MDTEIGNGESFSSLSKRVEEDSGNKVKDMDEEY